MAHFSRDAARALVEDIATSHGYIPPAVLDAMAPEVRRVVENAMSKKDNMIASSVFTLARNLYSSTARFIFELLQNADDNRYTRAAEAKEQPFVNFNVYHDRLVMECNEDGFNEANLRAICDIGKSSKQGAQGYIGEKGIGFKSTFMAAWKVEIQSGPLSFYFSHRRGDAGMGMVTPIWVEPRNPTARTTTTTLFFHDDDGPDQLAARRNEVLTQLRDLSGEVLLFLQNLAVIKIAAFDRQGFHEWSKDIQLLFQPSNSSLARLETTWYIGKVRIKDSHLVRQFYVLSHQAKNLAKNDNRTYTQEEERAKAYGTAKITVAFPFDHDWKPVIEPQELFAFMPVRKVGFNFLIHSDFVTQANRQDIVSTSERNIDLRRAVAVAISRAMQGLCSDHRLRYTWMRYLPRQDGLPIDPFWKQFVPILREALMQPAILFARDESFVEQFSILQLRRFQKYHLNKLGNPLIPDDPATPKYISSKYNESDVEILGEYGLRFLSADDLLPRLEAFVKTQEWRNRVFAHFGTGVDDWDSRMAKLLLRLWEDQRGNSRAKLQWMPLLPLSSMALMSSGQANGGVFFPDINGVSVPTDIGLNLIYSVAAANPDCRKLYEKLGVRIAIMSAVRESIIKKHKSRDGLSVISSSDHLRYLYLTDAKDPMTAAEIDHVVIFDHENRSRQPKKCQFVYFRGAGEPSDGDVLEQLLAEVEVEGDDVIEVPDVSFMNRLYLEKPPNKPEGYDKNYEDWVYDILWVDRSIQIFTIRNPKKDDPKIFTPEWIFLAKRRPDLVLSRLCKQWEKESIIKLWVEDPQGSDMIKSIAVLCTDGRLHPLRDTFVPVPSVVDRCSGLLKNPEKAMPFVEYPRLLGESDGGAFLAPGRYFEFGTTDDVGLSLAILQSITHGYAETTQSLTKTVLSLYLRIHAQCIGSDNRAESETKVRSAFQNNYGLLCSPSHANAEDYDSSNADWAALDGCVLDAPLDFGFKEPIGEIWKPVSNELNPSDQATLDQFFRHTLQIKPLVSADIMDELKALGEQSAADPTTTVAIDFLQELYARLDEMRAGKDERMQQIMKELFQTHPFIYVPPESSGCDGDGDGNGDRVGGRWYKVSECIWSANGTVLGKTCLEPHYPDLAPFFVDFLGVRKLDLKLVMQDITAIGGEDAEVGYVKTLLWALNTLLQSDTTGANNPAFTDEARAARVFPVRMPDGSVKTVTAQDDFAINDRQSFADALRGKIKFLDFTLAEVSRLQPLIQWAGLKSQLLSHSVLESTVVRDDVCTTDRYMTLDLSRKARALASVRMHFVNSSDTRSIEAFHERLRGVKVYTAEQIRSTFSLEQDGKMTTLPSVESEIHISSNADTGSWDIYLSADDEARDFCVASRLPRELGALLLGCKPSAVDPRAVGVLTSIIHAKRRSISRVLESNGIEELVNLPLREGDDDDMGFETLSISAGGAGIRPRNGGVTRTSTQDTVYSGADFESWELATPLPELTSVPGRVASGLTAAEVDPRRNEQYSNLLKHIVQEARNDAIPASGASFDPSTQSLFRFSIGDQNIWRRMVGAAGELYLFELLSNLQPNLPGFDLSNWQSSVRTFASAHPDYANMQAWDGSEASDLFYSDVSGGLTALLIGKGYLDEKEWSGEKPEYFIEVKTTMLNNFGAPFYVSKWQYRRMQSLSSDSNSLGGTKKKIYALFRLYGLESGRVGMKLFLDPDAARRRGQLEFEAEGWTVTARGDAL